MKTSAFVSSCSSSGSCSSPKRSSWCFLSSTSKNPYTLQRSMKKSRLSDFCCAAPSTASAAPPDCEQRPMVSAAASSCCSSSSSSVSVQQEWRDVSEMQSVARKRVMVVVDESREAETALLWALSHVVHRMDVVTLLHVLHSDASQFYEDSRAIVPDKTRLRCEEKGCELISSLKSLCAMRQPEVDVEVVVVAGEKGPAIVRQAKKLDSSILVLGQKKLSFLQRCLRWNRKKDDQLVDYCIQHSDCLTLSVRRKSKQCGGYLINSKWQKNFWLLA